MATLQVEQGQRPLMDLTLPLKTAMGATAWQQWRWEIAVKTVGESAFCLSINDLATYTERQQQQLRGPQRLHWCFDSIMRDGLQ